MNWQTFWTMVITTAVTTLTGFLLGYILRGKPKAQRFIWLFGVLSWICASGTFMLGVYLVIYGVIIGPDKQASFNGTTYTAIGAVMVGFAGLLTTLAAKLEQERKFAEKNPIPK